MKTNYNPERRAWKGKSYKKSGRNGAKRVRDLRDFVAETEGMVARIRERPEE